MGLRTTKVTENECTSRVEADLEGVERPLDATDTSVEIPKLPRNECMVAVPGRPFFDSSGKQLQASASARADACWARSTEKRGNAPVDSNSDDAFFEEGSRAEKNELALEWTE